MRIRRLEGRSPVLGLLEVSLPAGLIAVVGRDAHSLGAFVRVLRRGLLSPESEEEPVGVVVTSGGAVEEAADLALIRLGLGGEDDPSRVLVTVAEAIARLRGGARIERAARRLGIRGWPPRDFSGVGGEALPPEIEGAEAGEVPEDLDRLEAELRELRADHAEVAGDVEVATMAWLRERQDAETHLQAYRDRARELKTRLTQLEGAGAQSPCPSCKRLLHDRFDDVVTQLREEWESVVQDGSWWKRRREQLDLKPVTLQKLEGRSLRLHAATEECAERLERTRASSGDALEAPATEAASEAPGDGLPRLLDSEPVPETLATAMTNVRARLRDEAEDRVGEIASRVLSRITGSRLLALVRSPRRSVELEGVGERVEEPTSEDRAAAVMAIRIGAAIALVEDGHGLPGFLVLDSVFDRMAEETQFRSVALLNALLDRIPQVILVTRGGVVDRSPEAFDTVLELRSGDQAVRRRDEGPSIRPLLSGLGAIRFG